MLTRNLVACAEVWGGEEEEDGWNFYGRGQSFRNLVRKLCSG